MYNERVIEGGEGSSPVGLVMVFAVVATLGAHYWGNEIRSAVQSAVSYVQGSTPNPPAAQ